MSCVGPAPRLLMALVAGSAVMVSGTFVPQYHCRWGQLRICGMERKYQCVSTNCPSALFLAARSAACLSRLARLPIRGDWPRHRFISSQASGISAAAGRTDSLIDQVETAVREMCGIRPGSLLVLSVSGGSDSVALLELMVEIRRRWSGNLILHVVHFDHRLRPESAEEGEYVRGLCQKHGIITFHQRLLDDEAVDRFSKQQATGMQEFARDWRRRELCQILDEVGGVSHKGFILTAHHAGDHIESVLMKLVRGVHLTKITGMDYAPMPGELPFARPLLGVSKDTLVAWLQERGVEWREDESNAGLKYKRNRVRHQLVPLLEELCGGDAALSVRVGAVVEQSRSLRDLVHHAAQGFEGGGVDGVGRRYLSAGKVLRAGGEAVRQEVLHRFFVNVVTGGADERGSDAVGYKTISRVLKMIEGGTKEWEIPVGGGYVARRAGDMITCYKGGGEIAGSVGAMERVEVQGDVTVVTECPSWKVIVERMQPEEADMKCRNGVFLYNIPDGSVLSVRTRKGGEVFWACGRPKKVALKDYLRHIKMDLGLRNSIPLIIISPKREALQGGETSTVAAVVGRDGQASVVSTDHSSDSGDHRGLMVRIESCSP